MASIWVPCPKTVLVAGVGSKGRNSNQRQKNLFPCASNPNPSLSGFKVAAEKSSNSAPVVDIKSKVASPNAKDESAESGIPDTASISSFMTQASDLIKLVDSRDIVEVQLKQFDCELIIRKKEALQQPALPVVAVQPPYPQPVLATPPPVSAPTPAPASPAPAPSASLLPPAPKARSTSSHPPLKCPMAGTFYRCPAPSEPPFVKVGDKVQKGQVICIIEAMKLMNEIEAEQSGTIAEILVEDGKSVSVDTPLFVIAP